ncbi:MAG: hydroxymethylglutaryl-CoA lyase [Alphaproteobacteria bacterium]|nr:hydroxymethylglutaryl-CoA lyase [Alphaproteobacteria bacterium]
MMYPKEVNIVEVGPRDGLQNEVEIVSVEDRVWLINQLAQSGLKKIEVGSFVSPKWVPQMADTDKVLRQIKRYKDITYITLVPNSKGFEQALISNVNEIAIFAAASETFSQKNINSSITESFERFIPVCEQAVRNKIPVRGYLSCVLGCPYEGYIAPEKVGELARKLLDLGCYEISLGDTIGVGTPFQAVTLIDIVGNHVPRECLAVHFHDTYGQALANIYAVLERGIKTIDSSIAGLGGCPYAKGASGNVATEDLVYMLNGLEIKTSVNLDLLIQIGQKISKILNRSNASKVGRASKILN